MSEIRRVDFLGVPSRDVDTCLSIWNPEKRHTAFFADPDGNELMLHHRYAPYSE